MKLGLALAQCAGNMEMKLQAVLHQFLSDADIKDEEEDDDSSAWPDAPRLQHFEAEGCGGRLEARANA